jgi:rubrerythrin
MTASSTDALLHHFKDETDAAFLYRELAAVEPDAKRKDLYLRLADVEDRH